MDDWNRQYVSDPPGAGGRPRCAHHEALRRQARQTPAHHVSRTDRVSAASSPCSGTSGYSCANWIGRIRLPSYTQALVACSGCTGPFTRTTSQTGLPCLLDKPKNLPLTPGAFGPPSSPGNAPPNLHPTRFPRPAVHPGWQSRSQSSRASGEWG